MRKFKFLALAFAAFSFAACSDDAIEGQSGNGGSAGDGTPAYLTISFTANGGSSSRADGEGINTGDTDGSAEDSGHDNKGTDDEVAVKEALVIVSPDNSGGVGFAKLYTATGESADLVADSNDEEEETTEQPTDLVITDTNSKTYRSGSPIRVATGSYKVLVVINPVSDLTDLLDQTTMSLTNGADVQALYKTVIEGKYETAAGLVDPNRSTTTTNTDNKYVDDMGNSTEGFMMANKEEVPVTLTVDNTPDNPQTATVNVERVISKVTFRSTTTSAGENIYPISVNTGNFTPFTEEGLIAKVENETTIYEYQIFNVAHDKWTPANTVYALYSPATEPDGEISFVGAYAMTTQALTVDVTENDGKYSVTVVNDASTEPADGAERKYLNVFTPLTPKTSADYDDGSDVEKEGWYVVDNVSSPEQSLVWQFDSDESTWYVKLEGYALTNLSKEVHYVRHTTTDTGNAPFGILTGENFLYTPYFNAQNSVNIDADGEFVGTPATGTWFYNTLADVSTESGALTITGSGTDVAFGRSDAEDVKFFKPFSTLGTEGGAVTGDGNKGQHTGSGSTLDPVGKLMAYCYENATDVNHQIHGLSTGIAFVARMYKTNTSGTLSNLVERLYLYNDNVYESLAAIQEAYGANTPAAIVALVEKGDATVTEDELEKAGIERYNDGVCYYYTSRIKHFDNGLDNDMGNMEFAIMRNNIYSIAVSTIRDLGSPSVDPTPGVPNESSETALELNVTMEPWIVRYNDIEF